MNIYDLSKALIVGVCLFILYSLIGTCAAIRYDLNRDIYPAEAAKDYIQANQNLRDINEYLELYDIDLSDDSRIFYARPSERAVYLDPGEKILVFYKDYLAALVFSEEVKFDIQMTTNDRYILDEDKLRALQLSNESYSNRINFTVKNRSSLSELFGASTESEVTVEDFFRELQLRTRSTTSGDD